MKKLLCFLMIICCMIPILCALPVEATDAPAITYPHSIIDNFWEVYEAGVDQRSFQFRVLITDPPKKITFESSKDISPLLEHLEYDADAIFKFNGESFFYQSKHIHITIYCAYGTKWSDYPNASGQRGTVLSLLLSEETQGTILSALDSLAANIKTKADAEAFMPVLVQYLSGSVKDIASDEKPTPKWPIIAAIGGGVAVIAAVPAAIYFVTKRKKSTNAS